MFTLGFYVFGSHAEANSSDRIPSNGVRVMVSVTGTSQ